TGEDRQVDLAAPLVALLRDLQGHRREEAFRLGTEPPSYVVFSWLPETPRAQDAQKAAKRCRRSMERTLKAAGLGPHFTPHALRHTFCSLRIASGVPPVYVQQQAGHASVEMTVGVYGSWFAATAPGAMDTLAAGVPSTLSGNKSGESGNNREPTGTED